MCKSFVINVRLYAKKDNWAKVVLRLRKNNMPDYLKKSSTEVNEAWVPFGNLYGEKNSRRTYHSCQKWSKFGGLLGDNNFSK